METDLESIGAFRALGLFNLCVAAFLLEMLWSRSLLVRTYEEVFRTVEIRLTKAARSVLFSASVVSFLTAYEHLSDHKYRMIVLPECVTRRVNCVLNFTSRSCGKASGVPSRLSVDRKRSIAKRVFRHSPWIKCCCPLRLSVKSQISYGRFTYTWHEGARA